MKKKRFTTIAIAVGIIGVFSTIYLPPLVTHIKNEAVRKVINIINFHDSSRRTKINAQIKSLSNELVQINKRINALDRRGGLGKRSVYTTASSELCFSKE